MSKRDSLILVLVGCMLVTGYGYYRLSLPNCTNSLEACATARANTMSIFYIMTPILWIVSLGTWWKNIKAK